MQKKGPRRVPNLPPCEIVLNLASSCRTGQLLRSLYVVCDFFEVFPVDAWDFAFELVVLFFGALFVRGLAVGSAVVREVADAWDFTEVFPRPRADAWPVFFFDWDGDRRLVLAPVSLICEPKSEVTDGRDIISNQSVWGFLRKTEHNRLSRFVNTWLIWNSLTN